MQEGTQVTSTPTVTSPTKMTCLSTSSTRDSGLSGSLRGGMTQSVSFSREEFACLSVSYCLSEQVRLSLSVDVTMRMSVCYCYLISKKQGTGCMVDYMVIF